MSSVNAKQRRSGSKGIIGHAVLSCAGAAAFLVTASALSSPAVAASPVNDGVYGADLPRLSNAELSKLRGGVMVDGVDFDFGAIVTVRSGNTVLATTVYTMNSDGSLSHTTTIPNGTTGVTVFNGSPGGLLNGTGITVTSNGNSTGIVFTNQNGTSVTLNTITAGQMQALLANNAFGRQITQTVNANLTINNFTQLNGTLMSDLSTMRALIAGTANPMLNH